MVLLAACALMAAGCAPSPPGPAVLTSLHYASSGCGLTEAYTVSLADDGRAHVVLAHGAWKDWGTSPAMETLDGYADGSVLADLGGIIQDTRFTQWDGANVCVAWGPYNVPFTITFTYNDHTYTVKGNKGQCGQAEPTRFVPAYQSLVDELRHLVARLPGYDALQVPWVGCT